MVHAPSWEAQDGGAVHVAGHLRAALSDLLEVRRGAADHGGAAVRASRRHLAALPATDRRVLGGLPGMQARAHGVHRDVAAKAAIARPARWTRVSGIISSASVRGHHRGHSSGGLARVRPKV